MSPGRKSLIALFLFAGFLGAALVLFSGRPGSKGRSLETFGEVPPFELVDQSGSKRSLDQLKGKVWIANFLFTHCPNQCPTVTAKLRRVQDRMRKEPDLRLVSFTVDPTRDTSQVLAEYARRHGADFDRWFFLTGPQKTIDALSLNGFRLGSGETATTHSFKLVLVDRQARIRGYYDGLDDAEVFRAESDARSLLAAPLPLAR